MKTNTIQIHNNHTQKPLLAFEEETVDVADPVQAASASLFLAQSLAISVSSLALVNTRVLGVRTSMDLSLCLWSLFLHPGVFQTPSINGCFLGFDFCI